MHYRNLPYVAEKLIRSFMEAYEQPCYAAPERTPPETALLRGTLIEEEIREYDRAPYNSIEELDGLCDVLYVVIGSNIAMGVPLQPPVGETQKWLPMKRRLYPMAIKCIQDLYCRFPCMKTQTAELNRIISAAVNIGVAAGYNLASAFQAVHNSNMAKLWPEPPTDRTLRWKRTKYGILVKDINGKVIKPANFIPPDLTPFMPNAGAVQ